MLNALTIDVEDYFQVQAFSRIVRFEDWDQYECRIEHNTYRLLEIINTPATSSSLQHRLPRKATFFCLGWIAERYPRLIRDIHQEGHEIACHGYAHKLIYRQSPEEFRSDLRMAKTILEDLTGAGINGYRAPGYSITSHSTWAIDILLEEGFKYDSSIFPVQHDFYGMPGAPRFPFLLSSDGQGALSCSDIPDCQKQSSNRLASLPFLQAALRNLPSPCLYEFPLSTVRLGHFNFPVAGGGYFRLIPYALLQKGIHRINEVERQPFIFYLHPWELDPEQPKVRGAGWKSFLRHYTNLHKTESRFKKLLGAFHFSTLQALMEQYDAMTRRYLSLPPGAHS